MDEFDRIDRILRPLAAGYSPARGLTDDAAVFTAEELGVAAGSGRLVVTTDTVVEGVHYLGTDDPALVAQKALRVNLSDLAAMASRPVAYTLSLALPGARDDGWLERFAGGLMADQKAYGIGLAGGDSVSTPGPATITVTAFGAADAPVGRDGARPGDRVFVTGSLGDAALGLLAAQGRLPGCDEAAASWLIDRYRLPRPRLGWGRALGGIASAMLDLSDGLAGDLAHIAAASGVGARIDPALLPLSQAARAAIERAPDLRPLVAGGGDDYELCFTLPPGVEPPAVDDDVAITEIGHIVEGDGVLFRTAEGQWVPATGGYRHGAPGGEAPGAGPAEVGG